MGSRPKRFDVAGLHPDEVCEALGELARTVEEIGRQVGLERITRVWAAKPACAVRGEFRCRRAALSGKRRAVHRWLREGLAARFKQGAAAGPGPVQRARRFDGESSAETPGGAAGEDVEFREGECLAPADQQGREDALDGKDRANGQGPSSHSLRWQRLEGRHGPAILWGMGAKCGRGAEKTGMYPPMPEGARSWDVLHGRAPTGERQRSARRRASTGRMSMSTKILIFRRS